MANYRPKSILISASITKNSGVAYTRKVTTNPWGLFLLKGTAVTPNDSALVSGCVQVWEDNAATTGQATHTTFTDEQGRYGVTCKAGVKLVVKFLGK